MREPETPRSRRRPARSTSSAATRVAATCTDPTTMVECRGSSELSDSVEKTGGLVQVHQSPRGRRRRRLTLKDGLQEEDDGVDPGQLLQRHEHDDEHHGPGRGGRAALAAQPAHRAQDAARGALALLGLHGQAGHGVQLARHVDAVAACRTRTR